MTGEQVYNKFCFACHATGITDAPRFANAEDWAPRIAKGMDVAGAAESLASGDSPGSVFSRVMHQHNREVELPLKQAKVGQQPGHFGGVVLVQSMQSHQGIQK